MYNNQSVDDRVRGSVNHERYDVQSEGTGRRYLMKWSPQEDMKFYSKSRYGSPRMLSRSVPRKNKNLARIRINRSLNFDAGMAKRDLNFKSPNSSLDSICCDDANQLSEKQLSRSAKIMRALNLSSSLHISAKKKVNKTLNFDMSPSPKQLSSYSSSPCNIVHLNLSTSSPKITKTLHFDSSPAESNISSILGTSIDSIDENQNQTPSQRRRSAKKSLKYLTPLRKSSIVSSDFNGKSPMLRAELKEKIDNIIHVATPNLQPLKKSNRKPGFVKEVFFSTPRNLFDDFDDEDSGGSKTPNNNIRPIPGSMSAIKRNHKKERVSRRLETGVDVMTNEALEIELTEKLDNQKQRRSVTPPVQEDLHNSNYDVNSIKRSHKKDKSQRKWPLYRSEDELSDAGSIFDYSGIKDISSSCEAVFNHFEGERNNATGNGSTDMELLEDKMILTPVKLNYESDSEVAKINDSVQDFTSSRSEKNKVAIRITSPTTPTNEAPSKPSKTLPANQEPAENARPSTPKNRFDFLQRVMGSSIKKSHKKIKDENKKKLLKPRMLQNGLDDVPNQESQEHPSLNSEDPQASCSKNKETHTSLSSNRAATPDNINSSRLLLHQFSSVKKSHKKDKTSKILSSFARRQKIFSYDKGRLSSSNCGARNPSSLANDFKSYSLQQIDSRSSETTNDGISELQKIQGSPRSTDSSPNKRKLSSCSDSDEACTPLSMDDSVSINYVTAEEEFKIFTPIKKRRAAPTRRLSDCEYEFEDIPLDKLEDVPLTRCTTPVLDQSRLMDSIEDNFFTPERSTYALNVSEEPRGKSTPKNKTTPKNRLTVELMSNVNSIKQSHRKDKKGSGLSFKNVSARLDIETETRVGEINSPLLRPPSNFLTPDSSLLSDNVSDGSFRNISLMASKFLQSYEYEHSKPSTSYESRDDNDDGEGKKTYNLTATPPNLMKTKGYLRIFQNDSIKKSHKKKREELRHSTLFQDPEMSDDGSIFSEEDRIEDFPMDRAMNRKSSGKNLTEDRVTVVVNMNESLFAENLNEKRRSFQHPNPYNGAGNSSDDGSIFDSDEKLEDRFNDFNEM